MELELRQEVQLPWGLKAVEVTRGSPQDFPSGRRPAHLPGVV